jgi:hypothetical protein
MLNLKSFAFVAFLVAALSVGSVVEADEFRTIRSTNGKLAKSENPAFTVVSLSDGEATTITQGIY